jgi:hypothetical protein
VGEVVEEPGEALAAEGPGGVGGLVGVGRAGEPGAGRTGRRGTLRGGGGVEQREAVGVEVTEHRPAGAVEAGLEVEEPLPERRRRRLVGRVGRVGEFGDRPADHPCERVGLGVTAGVDGVGDLGVQRQIGVLGGTVDLEGHDPQLGPGELSVPEPGVERGEPSAGTDRAAQHADIRAGTAGHDRQPLPDPDPGRGFDLPGVLEQHQRVEHPSQQPIHRHQILQQPRQLGQLRQHRQTERRRALAAVATLTGSTGAGVAWLAAGGQVGVAGSSVAGSIAGRVAPTGRTDIAAGLSVAWLAACGQVGVAGRVAVGLFGAVVVVHDSYGTTPV